MCVCVHCVSNESVSPADEDEPEDAVSDLEEVPKSKKKKKAKKSSRENRSSKRQRPIREVSCTKFKPVTEGILFSFHFFKDCDRFVSVNISVSTTDAVLLLILLHMHKTTKSNSFCEVVKKPAWM